MGTYVFGGGPVIPSDYTLATFENFENPLQLSWPLELAPESNVTAFLSIFNSDEVAHVYVGNATQVGVGMAFVAINAGSANLNIFPYQGVADQIVELLPGAAVLIYLIDNSTPSGVWSYVEYGSGGSNQNADELAGLGLIALPGDPIRTLNTCLNVVDYSDTNVDVTDDMRASVLRLSSDVQFVLLTQESGYIEGFFIGVYNNGNSLITIQTDGDRTINGQVSIQLLPAQSCFISTDSEGSFTTVGLETTSAATISLVTIPIAADQTFVDLTADQLVNNILVFTGAPEAPCTIYFGPPANDEWIVHNRTTSNQQILLSMGQGGSPTGTLYQILTNQAVSVYSNATSQSLNMVSPVYPTGNPYKTFVSVPSPNPPQFLGSFLFSSQISAAAETININGGQSIDIFTIEIPANQFPSSQIVLEITGVILVGPSVVNPTDSTTLSLVKDGTTAHTISNIISSTYTNKTLLAVPLNYSEVITDTSAHTYAINVYVEGAGAISRINASSDESVDNGISSIVTKVYVEPSS